MVFIVPAASRGLAGPSDPIASLCREAQCRQRPERQRGRSSVLHRRKGDEEGRLTFLQRDVRLPAGRLFFFRGQFLYLRQPAGGLFFFRRRKKNQERRHPFERVDDDQRNLSSGLQPKITARPSHHRLLPALPCRPGETLPLPAARLRFVPAGRWPDRFHFTAAVRPAPPARRVGRVETGRVP